MRASATPSIRDRFLKEGSDNEDCGGQFILEQQGITEAKIDWSDSDEDADEKAGATYTSLSIKEECQTALEKAFRDKETYDRIEIKNREEEIKK